MTTLQMISWFFQTGPFTASPVVLNRGRGSLAEFYREMHFTRGAEIGVRRGAHAKMLCQTIPGLELLCVDPWEPQDGYLESTNTTRKMWEAYAEAQTTLAPYRCQFIRETSVVGSGLVADRSLDFVYIDANHRADFVLQDLELWTPKVRVGGILGGHDYVNMPDEHIEVKDAVDVFTADRGIAPWFVLTGSKGDRMPSYFWVVE